jgi:anthranilate/para-aminobenzoate synthase component I
MPLPPQALRLLAGDEPRLDLPPDPVAVAAALLGQGEPGPVFLDSSNADETGGGGISLVAARPLRVLRGDIWRDGDALRAALGGGLGRPAEDASIDTGIPAGGLFGTVDYDGAFCFGDYPGVLVFDHRTGEWSAAGSPVFPARVAETGPAEPPGRLEFIAQTGREGFVRMVRRAQEYIAAGDIYQVNLSRRFTAPVPRGWDAFAFYRALRTASPAPHAAFIDLGGRRVLSSSPELFLRMSGDVIATRPVKGTRPRFADPGRDERSAYDLITSAKEVAELVMITDLERNDLGQVCAFGSVEAVELLKLERFAQVFHLVSTVRGTLRPGTGHVEALARCFPGGSITGAPKRRAREVIEELEPASRGLYTGAIGYFGRNGESQFNIAIRTAVESGGTVTFHSGAGIVADSDPDAEFDETCAKAAGVLRAAEGR